MATARGNGLGIGTWHDLPRGNHRKSEGGLGQTGFCASAGLLAESWCLVRPRGVTSLPALQEKLRGTSEARRPGKA
ncbi:MAG: hypothetical protein NZM42_10940 [Gemmatales bacterium]|nr:hypothetical protein [Gemmatales bacterium]MDW8223413.1 hypothetical protein [Gemmatales bacterium]